MFPNEQISLAAAAAIQRQFIHIASAGRLGRVKLRDAASWYLLCQTKIIKMYTDYRLNQFSNKMRTCQAMACA